MDIIYAAGEFLKRILKNISNILKINGGWKWFDLETIYNHFAIFYQRSFRKFELSNVSSIKFLTNKAASTVKPL